MNALERAVAARKDTGHTIAGIRHWRPASLGLTAAEFGLSASANVYAEINPQEAANVLSAVLHKDMAYSLEIMPLEEARALTADVVRLFNVNEARFFTNGTYGQTNENQNVGASWMAATDATFDTGILVLAPASCACLWFADED